MTTNTISITVKKSKLAENGDYNLTADRYRETVDYSNAKWPMVELGEVLDYEQPTDYIVETENYNDKYKTPVLTAGKSFLLGYTNEENGIFPAENLPVIIFDDFTTATKFVDFPFKVKSSAMKILKAKENVNISYAFYMMQKLNFDASQHKRYWISQYSKIQIPLPPLEVQEQIVAEIEKYQKVIDGAKQVVENWKPSFRIDPSWEMVELGEVVEIQRGGSPRPIDDYITKDEDGINWIKIGDVPEGDKYITKTKQKIKKEGLSKTRLVKDGDFILSNSMSFGRPYIVKIDGAIHDGWLLIRINDQKQITSDFLYQILGSDFLKEQYSRLATGGVVRNLNSEIVRGVKIPLPPLSIQEQIVVEIEEEQKAIYECKKLIEKMQKKIKVKISEVWGEEI
jgi:restriction endonuclease S subunit